MKVLLINLNDPKTASKLLLGRPWPPLDLLNCAGLLEKNNIFADILDLRAQKISKEALLGKIKGSDLTFITSSPIDRWQCPDPEISGLIAFLDRLPDKEKIYLAGAHASLYPKEILEKSRIKGVIKGQPENAVLAVCQNKITSNIVGPIEVNLDSLPLPAYEKINLNDYYYELMGRRFALLEGSRGCPYQCAFCLKVMYGDKIKSKNIQKVKEEIDYIVKIGAECLYFIDLEFTLDKVRVIDIADHIIKRNYKLKWCCQTRTDAVDIESLKLMRRAGCSLIHYGIESGSQRVLGLMNKKISLEKVRQALKITRQAGIRSAAFFMFGFPGETEEEMRETIEFAKELNPDYASFHSMVPYLSAKTNRGEKAVKMAKKSYLEFYLRPNYILSALLKPKQLLNQLKLFYNFIK